MSKPLIAVLVAAPMLLLTMPGFAAGNIKPGLWEMTMQSDMMKNMPKMSPEQIQQMGKMGIDMAQLQSGAIVNKICITKEMAERDEVPQMSAKETGCELKNAQRSGATYTVDMVCNGPAMKGKGTIKTVYASDQSFSASSTFKGAVGGRPVDDRNDSSGKWLSANCGLVKPMQDPMQKK
ncbi:DUF3617 domain-containing protein [Herminiimonas sp. NPDC097707]|uniref:DUF3617 domain-containing protein n=1 Tax=Herminiimonas sp. NPDC097707 TaxID=3364007 RepID=UPI00383ACE5E